MHPYSFDNNNNNKIMENIFEELGIPKKYLKKSSRDDRYIALVHKHWLKYVII